MPAINASMESYRRRSEKANPYQQELQFLHVKRTVCLPKRWRRHSETALTIIPTIFAAAAAARVATCIKLFQGSSCVCVRDRPRSRTKLHLTHRVIDHFKRTSCGWNDDGFARDITGEMQFSARHCHNIGRRKKMTPINNRPTAVRTAGNKLVDIFSPKPGHSRVRASAVRRCTNGRKNTARNARQ